MAKGTPSQLSDHLYYGLHLRQFCVFSACIVCAASLSTAPYLLQGSLRVAKGLTLIVNCYQGCVLLLKTMILAGITTVTQAARLAALHQDHKPCLGSRSPQRSASMLQVQQPRAAVHPKALAAATAQLLSQRQAAVAAHLMTGVVTGQAKHQQQLQCTSWWEL